MKQCQLISLGLWVTPFVFMGGKTGLRTPKEFVCLGVCLFIGLLAVFNGELKKFSNKWACLLIFWFMANVLLMPRPPIEFFGQDATGFWVWKPFLFGLVYLLAVVSISSITITERTWDKISNCFIYPALITSIYIFIQSLGLDQFFGVTNRSLLAGVNTPAIGGFIGQPTLVSPFIAMCVPFALFKKKYLTAFCMIIAVFMTNSVMSISALLIILFCYLILFVDRRFILVVGFIFICFISSLCFTPSRNYIANKINYESSGRFGIWVKIIKDWEKPTRKDTQLASITGRGAGSFQYVFAPRTKINWREAHNEYLEVLYNFGIGGLFLFVMSLFSVFKEIFINISKERILCGISLFCISLCAGGTFVWQLGTTAFYSIVLIGLIYNKDLDYGMGT